MLHVCHYNFTTTEPIFMFLDVLEPIDNTLSKTSKNIEIGLVVVKWHYQMWSNSRAPENIYF